MYPADLAAWHAWQRRQYPARALRHAVSRRRSEPEPLHLTLCGRSPRVLVALEARTPTQIAALVRPAEAVGGIAVLSPVPAADILGGTTTTVRPGASVPEALGSVRAVLGVGDYLPAGARARAWADELRAAFVVVQHGLLTPHAPPLPRRAHLLAFTERDARFWTLGRPDVTWDVVGSQLLWDAAAGNGTRKPVDPSARPVFLGQLHGAELPRWGKIRRATAFCRAEDAVYRPHPREEDKLSRLTHAAWERLGITVERNGGPLTEVTGPVVAAFSTGVLEAAARGLPAWVHYPDPPAWLEEFWDRYGLHAWGDDPTPAPPQPTVEPAQAIADRLTDLIEERP
ncbi:RNA-binding protein [Kocuria sp. M1R5S2]|uniref:RNA-binding protein n=1 Tax=Kocuria rhizosphaerae TaxID=3376285 RepID=UPI00378FA588